MKRKFFATLVAVSTFIALMAPTALAQGHPVAPGGIEGAPTTYWGLYNSAFVTKDCAPATVVEMDAMFEISYEVSECAYTYHSEDDPPTVVATDHLGLTMVVDWKNGGVWDSAGALILKAHTETPVEVHWNRYKYYQNDQTAKLVFNDLRANVPDAA